MKRHASLYQSYFGLGTDLTDPNLLPFFRREGLSKKDQIKWTLGVAAIGITIGTFLEATSGFLLFLLGAWIIWNKGNDVTIKEKKIYWSVVAIAAFMALVSIGLELNIGLFLVFGLAAFLFWLWRK